MSEFLAQLNVKLAQLPWAGLIAGFCINLIVTTLIFVILPRLKNERNMEKAKELYGKAVHPNTKSVKAYEKFLNYIRNNKITDFDAISYVLFCYGIDKLALDCRTADEQKKAEQDKIANEQRKAARAELLKKAQEAYFQLTISAYPAQRFADLIHEAEKEGFSLAEISTLSTRPLPPDKHSAWIKIQSLVLETAKLEALRRFKVVWEEFNQGSRSSYVYNKTLKAIQREVLNPVGLELAKVVDRNQLETIVFQEHGFEKRPTPPTQDQAAA